MKVTSEHLHHLIRLSLRINGRMSGYTEQEILAFLNRHFAAVPEPGEGANSVTDVVLAFNGIFYKISYDGAVTVIVSMDEDATLERGDVGALCIPTVTDAGANHLKDMLRRKKPCVFTTDFVPGLMSLIDRLSGIKQDRATHIPCDCEVCTEERKAGTESQANHNNPSSNKLH